MFAPGVEEALPFVVATLGTPTVVAEPTPQMLLVAAQEKPHEPIAVPRLPLPAHVRMIDLAGALASAGADNPTIALAEEAVRVTLAERMQARALLLPTLDAGTNLRSHQGTVVTGRGVVTDTDIRSLYWGAGADAKGTGTVAVPGVRLVSHLGDAYFAPKAAQRKVVQSQFAAAATRQYLLMEVGIRYLALVEAQARQQAYRQSLSEFEEIERLTAGFAKAKQGRQADADRAKSEAMLLRAEMERAAEAVETAAAEMARLLDWDPSMPLRSVEVVPPMLELVGKSHSLSALLDQAVSEHPEVVARAADVAFFEIRVRQEKLRPLLPVIAVGFSAGAYGGSGANTESRLGHFSARTDLDIAAIWSLPNAGVGNRALQNLARTGLESALIEHARTIDRIRREVTEAYALVETRRQEITFAGRRTETSQQAFTEELARAKNLKALPIELLRIANQLAEARQDLVRAITGFSQAQLQLYAALGNTPVVTAR